MFIKFQEIGEAGQQIRYESQILKPLLHFSNYKMAVDVLPIKKEYDL